MHINDLRLATPWRLAFVAALFAFGGCASTTETTPALEEAEEQPVASTQPAPTPVEQQAFDADGNPLVPGTTRPLARTFYFDYDRSVLKPDALAALEMHAQMLREHPDHSIVISGHADERGTREYNLALGERRADAVRDYLLASGVSSRQIQTVSYGEERPEAAGTSESAWSRNRRAVMDYTGGTQGRAKELADVR